MSGADAGQSESLFDEAEETAAQAAAPLAVRMRPRTLDEVIGQRHLTSAGTPFRKLAEHDAPMSLLLWGPPGTGKTTLAYVVSQVTRRRFVELSAVSAGVKDVRAAVDAARRTLLLTLQPLSDDDVREVVSRALADPRGLGGAVELDDEAADHLVRLAGGDARRALTYLEAAALGLPAGGRIDVQALE